MVDSMNKKTIQKSLSFLREFLNIKNDFLEINLSNKQSFKNIFNLSYYKNSLLHVFMNEAIISSAILTLKGFEFSNDEVTVEKVWEATELIAKVIKGEVVVRDYI